MSTTAATAAARTTADFVVLKDVPYTASADDRHRVDLYLPGGAGPEDETDALLILAVAAIVAPQVFLHGGAWRSNNRAMFESLARSLAAASGHAVAVPGYRLSLPAESATRPMHPAHQEDIEHALAFLAATAPVYGWSSAQVLVGHSAGAHLALLALLHPRVLPHTVKIAGVVGVDGIYDLTDLVAEYPDYAGFVAQAFGPAPYGLDTDTVAQSRDAARVRAAYEVAGCRRVLVVHSRDDELLTLRQSDRVLDALREGVKAAGVPVHVSVDYDAVKGKHDDLLNTDAFVQRVARFAAELEAEIKE
ncbi:hypothetical protein H9P43_005659 [Blastocladiella emersonii ATCC 22665]|nr:hypothetical protein H9P43_005659 [Blastocladiella emersonii ATCC 22665]